MPIQRPPLVNNEIYHIVIRGVGDSLIFKNKEDYFRMIFSLYEFNTSQPIVIRERRKLRSRTKTKTKKVAREQFSGDRDLLVEVLAFCFMPNHIHLLLRQIQDEGITQFMRKLGAGYATYFNQKYDRKGHLFQGRFRAVYIESDEQLQIVFTYIHTNSLSLIEPNWKEKGIKNLKKAIEFLKNYKWSSYPDYIGKKNFPSLTERSFLLGIMEEENGCQESIKNWIKYKDGVESFNEIESE
jgi:putative transposase